jgi:hypothetical protein
VGSAVNLTPAAHGVSSVALLARCPGLNGNWTNSMEQSPSPEANRPSATQKFPHFMEPEDSLPHSKTPPSVPILSHINPVHAAILLRSLLILSSHLRLGHPVASFHQVSPPNPCKHLSTPHTCHVFRPSHLSCDFTTRGVLDKECTSQSPSLPCTVQSVHRKAPRSPVLCRVYIAKPLVPPYCAACTSQSPSFPCTVQRVHRKAPRSPVLCSQSSLLMR